MLTRAQKRRVGERDLWDMIVNNDDICFAHILPRLNQTDIKFLYEVNSETRALITRSSRRDDLGKRFEVKQMSSISTLEFAWENRSLWPSWWNESNFCWSVARTNKLELLKWAREVKRCEWDRLTIAAAAGHGNMEMVKYCVAKECPIDNDACKDAASIGHLEILKYLHEDVKAPWDWITALQAAENGHLHILEYLVERKYDEFNGATVVIAAEKGHLDCLKYLHETAKAPWQNEAVQKAHENKHSECLQYLLDINCPLPRGWWYEGGTLFGEPTINQAAEGGNLEMIQYCVAKNCPMNGEEACASAASGGSLECLKYLHEDVKAPWDWSTAAEAAENGHLHILEYLFECEFKFYSWPYSCAAKNGHFKCLKFLRETAKAPWSFRAVRYALENNHSECLQYLLDNNCPLPEGWRYEHGKLYT